MAKKKAAAPRRTPARRAQRPAASESKIVTDGCDTFYADVVNVATGPTAVALTFYQTVPDPSTDSPKAAVRFAKAIAQIPFSVAFQIPKLINLQVLQRLDTKDVDPEMLEILIREIDDVRGMFASKLEQVRNDCG